jgi:hypothetical protein
VRMLSLSLLTFYCSPSFFPFSSFFFLRLFITIWIGLWLPSFSFIFWKEKKWNLSHLYTDLIESARRMNSLFWNARRKLARVNSNTLQLRSVHVCTCAYVYEARFLTHTHKDIHTGSLTWSQCEEKKTDNKRM